MQNFNSRVAFIWSIADLIRDRDAFEAALDAAARSRGVKMTGAVRKAILAALAERDETAAICRDKDGNSEPDPELRVTENVPLNEEAAAYMAREVTPYVPDARLNPAVRDQKDGAVGRVGYEINFNRYFHKYQPPRPLEEIEAEIMELQRGVAG
jgi:type I restriction enzyme M protein